MSRQIKPRWFYFSLVLGGRQIRPLVILLLWLDLWLVPTSPLLDRQLARCRVLLLLAEALLLPPLFLLLRERRLMLLQGPGRPTAPVRLQQALPSRQAQDRC